MYSKTLHRKPHRMYHRHLAESTSAMILLSISVQTPQQQQSPSPKARPRPRGGFGPGPSYHNPPEDRAAPPREPSSGGSRPSAQGTRSAGTASSRALGPAPRAALTRRLPLVRCLFLPPMAAAAAGARGSARSHRGYPTLPGRGRAEREGTGLEWP